MSRVRRSVSRASLAVRAMFAAVLLLGLGASPAFAEMYKDIDVVVQPQPAVEGTVIGMRVDGYIEHRIVVRNHSKTTDHRVRLIQPGEPAYGRYTDYLQENSRTIQVDRSSTSVVSLFEPPLDVPGNLAVEIDGVRQKEILDLPSPLESHFRYSPTPHHTMGVLTSRGVPQAFKDKVRAAHPNLVAFCRSELPTIDWSPNWLGYTAYDAVLLTDQEVASLPAEVLLALRRYAEAGGMVLVQGSSSDSEKVIPAALRDSRFTAGDNDYFHVGFGLVRPCPMTTAWPSEFWTAGSKAAVVPDDKEIKVVSNVDVPVRGLLLVVIVFAVGIGPVNVWLLSRRRKRMWLWWNVPAVSLATCLAVFAYSLISEGISGRGRSALITVLDENTHRAMTIGYVSYYCPLTPSDGLHFSYDTEVTPLHTVDVYGPGFHAARSGRSKSVDWTTDQHLESGWVVSRVPAYFAIRKNEARRERLAFRKAADGKLTVVNGLGVDIDSLIYADEKGAVSVANGIPAGQERALEPRTSDAKQPTDAAFLRDLFDKPWNLSLKELRYRSEQYVAPGCYLAVVKKNPFLEDPLVAAPQAGSFAIIYGIGARADDGR